MPDYFNNGRCDYSKFDSMTTEELEEILRQDVQNLEGDTDIDMLMYITEVIRKRNHGIHHKLRYLYPERASAGNGYGCGRKCYHLHLYK